MPHFNISHVHLCMTAFLSPLLMKPLSGDANIIHSNRTDKCQSLQFAFIMEELVRLCKMGNASTLAIQVFLPITTLYSGISNVVAMKINYTHFQITFRDVGERTETVTGMVSRRFYPCNSSWITWRTCSR